MQRVFHEKSCRLEVQRVNPESSPLFVSKLTMFEYLRAPRLRAFVNLPLENAADLDKTVALPLHPDLMEDSIIDLQSDEYFMGEALRLALRARAQEEVPIGAVLVREGRIIARAHNQVEQLKDATAHAEMLAITQAEAAIEDWRLTDCDLYVTKEPCPMCAGAIVHARVRRVIFGCSSPKDGAGGSLMNLLQHPKLNHRCQLTSGVLQLECGSVLQEFFREKRSGSIPPF